MTEFWKSNERHYCKLCNAWMANDRQSIALHEGGKKHKDMFTESLRKKRETLQEKDRAGSALQAELATLNAAASAFRSSDASLFSSSAPSSSSFSSSHSAAPGSSSHSSSAADADGGVASWHEQKRRRLDEREKGPAKSNVALLSSSSSSSSSSRKGNSSTTSRVVALEDLPDEETGHYDVGGVTYLEGLYFARLLKPDVAAQCWLLPSGARPAEGTAEEDEAEWISGLITEVRTTVVPGTSPPKTHTTVDFSFLPDGADDEVLSPDLPASALRLRCGDYGCPPSLPSALSLVLSGVTAVKASADPRPPPPPPGADGEGGTIGAWETIEVRTVSRKQEQEEEEERRLEQEALADAWGRQQEAEARTKRLELAKFESKDDSALGSYNVYGSEGGYKGVAILKEGEDDGRAGGAVSAVLEAGVLAKEGEKVEFKKKSRPTGNKRVTGGDD